MYHIVVSNKKILMKKIDINVILNDILREEFASKVVIYDLCKNRNELHNNTEEIIKLDAKFLFKDNNILNFEYISRVIKNDTKFISINLTELNEVMIDILFSHLGKYLGIKENLQYIIYVVEDSYLQNYSQKIKDSFYINSLNYNYNYIRKIRFRFEFKNLLVNYIPSIIKKTIIKSRA